MSISNECMVATLAISRWYGFARDEQAGKAVADAHHADSDAANVNKRLLPRSAMKDVTAALSAVRTHFYESTLPWRDGGGRLLTRKMYMPFIEKHESLVREARVEIDKFIDVTYPAALDRAEFRMGSLLNPNDYPSQAELRRKYRVHLDFEPVSSASDFRVRIDSDHADAIRANIERGLQERIAAAMREVWTRLATTLEHFHERMADTDAKFKQATVTNLQELVDLLPNLNVLDDPDLEAIRLDIAQKFSGLDAVTLRQDDGLRTQVATEAREIIDVMEGFMTATGGSSDE